MFTCELCRATVDPNEIGTWKQVVGWVQNRNGGGTHSVAEPSRPMAYRHQMCQELRNRGISPGQGSLL